MADVKITALTAISANPVNPATFPMPMVDLLDNSQAASGSTRKVTVNQILGAGGTATLASATITGALTVDTSTLVVDATNDRVGINYATPGVALHMGIGGTNRLAINTAVTGGGDIQLRRGRYIGFSNAADSANAEYLFANGGALEFGIASSTAMTIDASRNVGIGVTPSAWNSNYNGLDIGQNGCIAGRVGSSNTIDIISNGFRNSAGNYVYKLATSNTACRYQLDGSTGSHIWYSGAAGTAGNTIAGFSTALMTLDALGNLILQSPSSPPTLGTNGQLTVNATSNTNLRFSYRGSDGTTRVANITLA